MGILAAWAALGYSVFSGLRADVVPDKKWIYREVG